MTANSRSHRSAGDRVASHRPLERRAEHCQQQPIVEFPAIPERSDLIRVGGRVRRAVATRAVGGRPGGHLGVFT